MALTGLLRSLSNWDNTHPYLLVVQFVTAIQFNSDKFNLFKTLHKGFFNEVFFQKYYYYNYSPFYVILFHVSKFPRCAMIFYYYILTTHSTLMVEHLDSSVHTSLSYVITGPVYVLVLLKPITQKVVSSFLFFGFNILKTLFGSLIALPDSFGFKHWTSPHFTVFRWRQ